MAKKSRRQKRADSPSPSQEARRQASGQRPRSSGGRRQQRQGLVAGLDTLTVVIIALVAVGIAAIVGLLIYQQASEGELGREVPSEGALHVEQGTVIDYQNYPPSSGPHYPAPYNWGVYTEEVPEGNFVHNLEHGGIVILYKCDEPCPDLERSLVDLYQTVPPSGFGNVKLLTSPYSKLQNPITALAWGWILEMDEFDQDRMLRFYKARLDKGPEQVP